MLQHRRGAAGLLRATVGLAASPSCLAGSCGAEPREVQQREEKRQVLPSVRSAKGEHKTPLPQGPGFVSRPAPLLHSNSSILLLCEPQTQQALGVPQQRSNVI